MEVIDPRMNNPLLSHFTSILTLEDPKPISSQLNSHISPLKGFIEQISYFFCLIIEQICAS